MKQATADELNTIILADYMKIKGLRTLTSLSIHKNKKPGRPNWDAHIGNFGGNNVVDASGKAMGEIVKKYQAEYELIADDT